MTVHKERMAQSTEKDFSNAKQSYGLSLARVYRFVRAHEIVGKLSWNVVKLGTIYRCVPLERYQEISSIIGPDIYTALESQTAVSRRNSLGGTGFESIRWQIQQAKEQLGLKRPLNVMFIGFFEFYGIIVVILKDGVRS